MRLQAELELIVGLPPFNFTILSLDPSIRLGDCTVGYGPVEEAHRVGQR